MSLIAICAAWIGKDRNFTSQDSDLHRVAATYWRLCRIPRFEAALMARLAYDDPNCSNLDWSGRGAYGAKLLGRILQDGLSGQSLLLKLNTYEGRLL